jgi:dTMP kinase
MLVVLEGLHSVGKSTQVRALASELRRQGLPVVTTEWNSSPTLGRSITQLKIDNRLGPTALVLMEAADLAWRIESSLGDALARDAVVVSDRWFYSTLVRGLARGIDPAFMRSCFAFAPEPSVVFHLRCDAQVTLARREAAGMSIGGHMSGEDYRAVPDQRRGFVQHQNKAAILYQRVLPAGTIELDATASAADLHAEIVANVIQKHMCCRLEL